MKKLAMVLAVAAAACTSSSDKDKTPTPKVGGACTQLNATECDGTIPLVCDGTTWTAGNDCALIGRICHATDGCVVDQTSGTKEEFFFCDTEGCLPGLACEASEFLQGSICFQDCGTDPTVCDLLEDGTTPGYCDSTSFLLIDGDTSVCNFISPRNFPCFVGAPAEACEGDAECAWNGQGFVSIDDGSGGTVFFDTSYECDETCDGAAVNSGQSTCEAGEECLAGPELELQGTAPTFVSCVTLGSGAGCDTAGNYTCMAFGDEGNFCARWGGRCGTPAPLQTNAGSTTDADANDRPDWFDTAADAEGAFCNHPAEDTWCAPAANGTAMVECAAMGSWYWSWLDPTTNAAVDCLSDLDCTGLTQEGVIASNCISGECGSFWQSCVAFCDDPAGGGDLSCPTAAPNCVAQDPTTSLNKVGPQIYQRDGSGNSITCTTAGIQDNCDADHICTNIGKDNLVDQFRCLKPLRKVCTL